MTNKTKYVPRRNIIKLQTRSTAAREKEKGQITGKETTIRVTRIYYQQQQMSFIYSKNFFVYYVPGKRQ